MVDNASSGVPQFSTAEYHAKPGDTLCKSCGREIIGSFYKVNGALACAACAQKIQDEMAKDSHAAFVRGILFGIGGAILGLILYVAFALITGLIAGIVSLAVGYLVGKAMVKGSGGVGGRRYQVAAVLLTYMAVSLAAVPIILSHYYKQHSAQAQAQAQVTDSATPPQVPKPAVSHAKAWGTLVLIALASPFLALTNPAQGAIGLIILFVGLRIAWRITAGRTVSILGPFREAVPATPA
jgi:hypothetical protein